MQYGRVVLVAAVAALVTRLFGVNPEHAPAGIVWFPPVDGLALGETLALAVLRPAARPPAQHPRPAPSWCR